MAVQLATRYGVHNRTSNYGEELLANDGNGDLYDPDGPTPGDLPIDTQALLRDKYLKEAFFELRYVAEECVERGELTYPPSIEDTLELANIVYLERYANSGLPRTELIDFLVAALIECLEARKVQLDEKVVEDYVRTVHEAAALQ